MNELDTLIVKQACTDVIMRYAIAVNESDVQGFLDVFAPDGKWNRPDGHSMNGHDEIRPFITAALPPKEGAERTLRHVNGGILVTPINDSTATAWSQTTVFETQSPPDLPVKLKAADLVVEYRDQMEKRDGKWLITQRDTTVVFAANGIPAPEH